jgi:Holliday junction resolvase-like predicted endonuclease
VSDQVYLRYMAVTASERTAAQRSGDAAEAMVVARLVAAGWHVLGRQVRVGRAELDLVAVDPRPPPALVVVEVRWRGSRDFGLAEETVDGRKVARLRAGLARLLAAGILPDGAPLPRLPARIDLVAVEPPIAPAGAPRFRHYRAIG